MAVEPVAPCLVASRLLPFERHRIPSPRSLSMDVMPGEIVVLLGPDETDRVSWLQVLAGLQRPDHGRLQLLGHETSSLDLAGFQSLRRRAGYTDGDAPLFSTFNVATNVMLPRLYHFDESPGQSRRVADELLDALDYDGQRDVLPAALGRLDTLKVLLARALVTDPVILFINEPFDLEQAMHWETLARQLSALARDENRTLFVATQNLAFASEHADRIIYVDEDGADACGTWNEFRSSANPRIRRFLEAMPVLEQAVMQ